MGYIVNQLNQSNIHELGEKMKKLINALSIVLIFSMIMTTSVFASSVDVAVVDVTAPIGSVVLEQGKSGTITINMSVTGKQDGTATFTVYKDWVLSDGAFTGSNPETFSVGPRPDANAPATTFSTSGAVSIAAGQAVGTFTLAVSTFDIENSNPTGAKLADGADSNYSVTVVAAPAELDANCEIDGYNGPYTGTPHGATGTCTYGGTELAGLSLGDSFTDVPGGTAHWTFNLTGYKSQGDDVAIVINKAPLTVTADDQTIIFGEALPTFTFKYAGFVNGEDASVIDTAPTCGVGPITSYGFYEITCSGGEDNNYSFSYSTGTLTVLAWTLTGFYQPVDMNGVYNTVKGGSTVPLKFEVFAGPTELTDVAVVDRFEVKGVACPAAGAPIDDIELTTTGGTSLRYDSVGGQFIQNWQTLKKPGVCYSVTMFTDDGSSIVAFFKLK